MTSTIRSGIAELVNGPTPDWPWTFVTIYRHQVRPGQEAEFDRLTGQAAAVLRDNVDWHWAWVTDLSGGESGPYMDLVMLAQNWAGMAAPDPSLIRS